MSVGVLGSPYCRKCQTYLPPWWNEKCPICSRAVVWRQLKRAVIRKALRDGVDPVNRDRSLAGKRAADTLREAIYERDGYRCVSCGTTENLTLDHRIPRARGGKSDAVNLQTMCAPCNGEFPNIDGPA